MKIVLRGGYKRTNEKAAGGNNAMQDLPISRLPYDDNMSKKKYTAKQISINNNRE